MAENGEQVDWLVRLKENIDGMLHSKNYARYAQIVSKFECFCTNNTFSVDANFSH